MTEEQLVDLFAEIALAQDEALLDDDAAAFNRLFADMNAVEAELRARPGDQRRALTRLYTHGNAQVRVKAAKRTLVVAPEDARNLLREISDSKENPQAMEAGMSLWALEEGIFKPT